MKIITLTTLVLVLFLSACVNGPSRQTNIIYNSHLKKNDLVDSAPLNYSISADAGPSTLVDLSLQYNPRVQALRSRALRLYEKLPQSRALPDPKATLALGSLPETAAGRVDAVVGLNQKVPFPGKRKAATLAALEISLAADAELQAFELKLTEQVYSAYWDYYLASTSASISRKSKDVLHAVEESVAAKVATNQGDQADQLRVANEITNIDRDLVQALQLEKTAAAKLNSLLNRPAGAKLPAIRSLPFKNPKNLSLLITQAETAHPEVLSARHRVEAFKHQLKRAKLEKYPDLTFGIQGAAVSSNGMAPSANGRDQIFGTLGFNIPLWQEPRKAMIREAQAGIDETTALVDSTKANLRYRIEDSYFRAQSAHEVSELFSTRLIPNSKQAYEVTLAGYSAGTQSFTNVIDTWKQWVTYQLQFVKNQAQLGKAIATLNAATGIK